MAAFLDAWLLASGLWKFVSVHYRQGDSEHALKVSFASRSRITPFPWMCLMVAALLSEQRRQRNGILKPIGGSCLMLNVLMKCETMTGQTAPDLHKQVTRTQHRHRKLSVLSTQKSKYRCRPFVFWKSSTLV